MKRLGQVMQVIGLLLWFAYGGLVMSWTGARPLQPDDLHTQAYPDKGATIFVSASELHWSWTLLAAAALFSICGTLIYLRGRQTS